MCLAALRKGMYHFGPQGVHWLVETIDERGTMTATTHDITRDRFMLVGGLARKGYDWWWHSFTARHAETGEERAFFVEFFTVNPELGGPEPLFGMAPDGTRDGRQPSYLMVKCGTWGKDARQLHRFFAWDEVEVDREVPYRVAAGDCVACETRLAGSVSVSAEDAAAHPEWMSDAGEMSFNLRVDKLIAFNVGYGASDAVRATEAFQMFWHAEGVKCAYEGEVILDGERYLVDPDTCFGYADKNWGSDFTTPWVWLASSDLTSRLTGQRLSASALEIGGGRPKVGPVALDRKLLGELVYEGAPYEFNFSKLWTGSKTEFGCHETEAEVVWHVEQTTHHAKLVTDVWCDKADMLLIRYEAPDGQARHTRLWNGGNGHGRTQLFEREGGEWRLVDDIDCGHMGCEYGEYDAVEPY